MKNQTFTIMKNVLYSLTLFLIPVVSYANSFSFFSTLNDISSINIPQVYTASLSSSLLVEMGAIILNTSAHYLLIAVIIALIMLFLLKSIQVLDSLKDLEDSQNKLLDKKDKPSVL